ncbi:MAG: DUF4197 domain-containing protein [Bacteroidota bacterium]|nr:DUF4197 domain-containing protein [Ferruginibacter sp.]
MKGFLAAIMSMMILSSCDVLQQLPTNTYPGTGVSQAEAAQGIKEALSQGLVKAVVQLNRENGFFGDALYKILLPPDAKKIENALRTVGLGKSVDKAILQINRGAEDAAGFAQPIFIDAIKQMSLTDAINIVRGGDTSATHYFRTKTLDKLTAAFSPVIKTSLDKVEATRYYGDIVKTYNNFPTTFNKVNPDLAGFVTERATNALFDLVAKEEKNIRENPIARTTEILKKVFGGLAR